MLIAPRISGSGRTLMTAIVKEELLDERLAKLETARSWSPRLVSKLESHIRSADDEALFRINPFNFASERSRGRTKSSISCSMPRR
jgi:hypothetical protein